MFTIISNHNHALVIGAITLSLQRTINRTVPVLTTTMSQLNTFRVTKKIRREISVVHSKNDYCVPGFTESRDLICEFTCFSNSLSHCWRYNSSYAMVVTLTYHSANDFWKVSWWWKWNHPVDKIVQLWTELLGVAWVKLNPHEQTAHNSFDD